jgi:hypothetical protein
VARTYNMNVAKTYKEVKKLAALGMVTARPGRGVEYEMVDSDLRRIALKLSERVQTYDSWRSSSSRRERFRSGMARVPPISVVRLPAVEQRPQKRMPGELQNLALLGRKKFDAKYRRTGERTYARV